MHWTHITTFIIILALIIELLLPDHWLDAIGDWLTYWWMR